MPNYCHGVLSFTQSSCHSGRPPHIRQYVTSFQSILQALGALQVFVHSKGTCSNDMCHCNDICSCQQLRANKVPNTALAHTSGAVGALPVDACSRRPPISFSRKFLIKSCRVKPYDSMAGMKCSSRAVHSLLRLLYAHSSRIVARLCQCSLPWRVSPSASLHFLHHPLSYLPSQKIRGCGSEHNLPLTRHFVLRAAPNLIQFVLESVIDHVCEARNHQDISWSYNGKVLKKG